MDFSSYKFPVKTADKFSSCCVLFLGRTRLEPLGIIMFAMILLMAALMVIEKALDDIWEDLDGHKPLEPDLDTTAYVVLTSTIGKINAPYVY